MYYIDFLGISKGEHKRPGYTPSCMTKLRHTCSF